MHISCGTQGIVNSKHPGQGIKDIALAGFQNIFLDLSVVCPVWELENVGKSAQKRGNGAPWIFEHPEEMRSRGGFLADQSAKGGLKISVSMAPYLNYSTKRDDLNNLLERLTQESVMVSAQAHCRYLIVRPLTAGIGNADLREVNRAYYLRLAERAKKYDIQLLLENQCRNHNGHLIRGFCADGRQAAQWVDTLNEAAGEERFGFCMDVGACNLCGQNIYDFVLSLEGRMKAVILRDCDGSSDSALLPFTSVAQGQSQTDWLNLIRGLREIAFDGELILDFHDTAAAFSPLLKPELIHMAKSVADYFAWQIGMESLLKKYPSRVLFGAGNMCRNYLKCYGEKYPPLFTCDNNGKLWGSVFEGLEVKNPQVLSALPKDCAVFICNIYYREIEEQLRQMGIENPIEFFNDEYMPSFYFDRLENR